MIVEEKDMSSVDSRLMEAIHRSKLNSLATLFLDFIHRSKDCSNSKVAMEFLRRDVQWKCYCSQYNLEFRAHTLFNIQVHKKLTQWQKRSQRREP